MTVVDVTMSEPLPETEEIEDAEDLEELDEPSLSKSRKVRNKKIEFTADFPFVPDYEIGGVPVMRIPGVYHRDAHGKRIYTEFPWYADADGNQRRASRQRPRVRIHPQLRARMAIEPSEKAVYLTIEQMHTVISCVRKTGWGISSGFAEGADGSVAVLMANGSVRLSIPHQHGGSAVYTLKVPDQWLFEVDSYEYGG